MSDARIDLVLGLNAAGFVQAINQLATDAKARLADLQDAGKFTPLTAGSTMQQIGTQVGQMRGAIASTVFSTDPEANAIIQKNLRGKLNKAQEELVTSFRTAGVSADAIRSNFFSVAAAANKQTQALLGGAVAAEQEALAIRETAAQQIANRERQAAVDAEVRRLTLQNAELTGVQRLQVRGGFLFGRQNLEGLPPTGPQILGQSLATIGRFAVAGAAFYAISRGITDTVKTAQQLEYDFSILESQMTALDRSGELPTLKKSLFEIARDTGLATDEVVQLGIAFVGALGDGGAGAAATNIAAKIAVVAQLQPKEIFNDLVAGMKAFADSPSPKAQLDVLSQIGDLSIQLRNNTGVASKEIIDFLGRVGPIARTTGLSLKDAAAAGAALLQGSAVGGASLGEEFGRILTGFSKNATEVAQIAQAYPQLGISIQQALSGDPKVLLQLAEGFHKLGQAQQQQLIQSVGSRREGQTLAILFQNSDTLLKALNATESAQGRVDTELAKRKQTLQLQVQQAKVAFQQFGLALYNSGVSDALKEITEVLKAFAEVLNTISGLMDHLPHQMVSFAAKLGLVIGALKGIAVLTAGKGNQAPSLLEAIGLGSLLRRNRGAGAAAGAESAAAGAAGSAVIDPLVAGGAGVAAGGALEGLGFGAGGALLGEGALSGIVAALGGPVTVGIVGATVALPMILNALHRKGGVFDSMMQRVKELRATDDGLGINIQTGLDKVVAEAGGDIRTVPKGQLQNARKSANKDDKKKIDDELKRRQQDYQAALLAFLRDQNVIDDQALQTIAGELSGRHADELLPFLEGKRPDIKDPRTIGLPGRGEGGTGIDLNKLNNVLGQKGISSGVQKKLDEALQAAGLMPTAADQQIQAVQDALASYDEGSMSLAELDQILQKEIDLYKGVTPSTDAAKQLAKDTREVNKRHDDAARENFDLQTSIDALSGGDPVAVARQHVSRLLDLLGQTRDPQDRVKVAGEIADAEKALLQEMENQASSSAEAAAILRAGIPLPKEVTTSLVYGEITATGGAIKAFLGQYLTSGLDLTDTMYKQMAEFITGGKSVTESLRLILQKQMEILNTAAYYGGEAFAAIIGPELDALQKALDALNQIDANYNFGIQVPGTATGSPTGTQAADDAKALQQAKDNYAKALVENDPIAAAAEAQREADQHFKDAKSDADRINAMADRVRADRQMAEAVQALAQSQIDLVIAMAEAAGNTLEAAYVAELKANQQLDYLRTHGGSEEQINNAKAAAATAHARTRDAALQEQEDAADFQHEMGQITDSQYVNLLKTMLLIPDLTEQQKRDIMLKIHAIEKSASSNLQFNLPTELGLPTLYEARRLNQLGGSYNASTYTDNRTVTVNLYAAAGVDTEAIASQVVAQFSTAPRTGITPRLY